MDDILLLSRLGQVRKSILENLSRAIIGQEEVIDQLLVCLLANSHALLVGVPGLAKTLLVSTFSRILDLSFSRIQFTPDLMPGDITGSEILEENKSTGTRQFRYVKGPVFANLVLADEINRTPPKTQAALLQAMAERQVTVAGQTYSMPEPFFVLATQNPIEQEGTYPLPEAQLDRFMFLIHIGYPSREEEYRIAEHTTGQAGPPVSKTATAEDLTVFQRLVRRIPVSETLVQFAVHLARKTRPSDPEAPDFIKTHLTWGAGPRASQSLLLAAKARAALEGRPSPCFDDIRTAAKPVLRHRIILNFKAEAEGVKADDIVDHLLETVRS